MFGARIWVGLLVLGMFAGCAGDDSNGAGVASTTPTTTVDVAKGTGAILGTVMDTEARPVPGVQVLVRQVVASNRTEVELSTDESGKFLVEGLELGAYEVYVSKLGYLPVPARRVDVVEGDPVAVDFEMEEIGVPKPHHKTAIYGLYVHNAMCLLACYAVYENSENWSDPIANAELTNGELMSLVFEASWVPTQGVCTMGLGLGLWSPEFRAFWYGAPDRASSSTYLLVNRKGDPDAMLSEARTEANGGDPVPIDGEWTASSYFWASTPNLGTPIDYDCSFDQDYTVAWTAFWVEPAPADFTALLAET